MTLFDPAEQEKAAVDQQNRCGPGKGEGVVQHWQGGRCPEYGADPDDAERAGAGHGAEGRVQRVSATPQNAGWNLIEIAERFKEQDAQDADSGTFHHSGFRRKKVGEKAPEQNDRKNGNRTANR